MDYKLAVTAGFCSGVKNAFDKLELFLNDNPDKIVVARHDLVHNHSVMDYFKIKGLELVDESFPLEQADVYVVNGHGDPKSAREAKDCGLEVVDTTCCNVRKLYDIVDQSVANGLVPVLFGDKLHPEVRGVIDYSDSDVFVVGSVADVRALAPKLVGKRLSLLSQTTQIIDNYELIAKYFSSANKVVCYNTICSATRVRQDEASDLAGKVNSMVVIGGLKSSNTRKLASICSELVPTQHVVGVDGLVLSDLVSPVGITAGASTPDWDITGVVRAVSDF